MINFLRYRFASLIFTAALLAACVGVYFRNQQTRGYAFSYSVDFTGGTEVLLEFDKKVDTPQIKSALKAGGWDSVTTREFSDTEMAVRVQEFSNDAKGLSQRIVQTLTDTLSDTKVTVSKSEAVGPGVGKDLRWKLIRAVLLSLILMLLYIAWRFWSVAFAVGAVVALFHDALVMLAAFLLFDRNISIEVVGAILAVIGYSINDTIVIFSQIRGNIRKMQGVPLSEIVNVSLNQTLKRTLLTSISTGLTVGSMFILGGEALRDFSLALLVGIVFGTYSSIYIASPIMMMLYKEEK